MDPRVSGSPLMYKEGTMAKNRAVGAGRVGSVKKRSQSKNSLTGLWTKRDTATGRFIDVKMSGGTFKGVRREN